MSKRDDGGPAYPGMASEHDSGLTVEARKDLAAWCAENPNRAVLPGQQNQATEGKKEMTMKAETLVTFGDLWDVTGEQHTMGHDLPVCVECPDDYDVDELEAVDIVCDGNIRVLSTDEAIDMWDAEG